MSSTEREVCIVDDDASVRTALGSLVRSLGYGARLFASAEEFLRAPHRADLVICDVQMPGLGGLELLELLRGRDDAVPFIVVTAFPQDAVTRRARDGGAACVLGKPFQAQALVRCIEGALPPDHTHV